MKLRVPHQRLLLFAAAVAVVSGAVLAQPELAVISSDPEKQLVDRIAELRAEGGPTTPDLIEPLRALALLYQENSDDALAAAAFEEARYVTRVHQGLASAEEALLLRQQLRSEKELADHERVWDLEQDMITIARQHHDDVRMLPIFQELADDRLNVIAQIRAGERPPMIYVGCYYGAPLPPYDDTRGARLPPVKWGSDTGGSPTCNSGSSDVLIRKLRLETLMYYADAIETILKTGDYASPELRQLERAALRVRGRSRPAAQAHDESGGSFAFCVGGSLEQYLALEILDSCLSPVGRAGTFVAANVGGQVGLMRLLVYEIRSAAPVATRANAIAELADWSLVRAHNDGRSVSEFDEQARSLYERALNELRKANDVRAATVQVFAPELPITLPAYEPNPFAAAATAKSSRHIDVAFAVTNGGRGERIEILDTSEGATRAEQRELVRLIERTSFRPRVVDGELAASAPVVVRYHLGQ
jgi:hypothetical protein